MKEKWTSFFIYFNEFRDYFLGVNVNLNEMGLKSCSSKIISKMLTSDGLKTRDTKKMKDVYSSL